MMVATTPVEAVAQPKSIPMVPNAWHAAPEVAWVGFAKPMLKFDDRYEGFPDGIMTVNEAVGVSNDARFASGTIDFDIKPLAYSYTGVIFRRDADGNGEFFYLRGDPDCPASNDCYQYTPVNHGMLQWNVYSNYQGPAPIQPSGWNHVHIVVAGEKMAVFLNHADRPILVVPKLRGLTAQGGIGFKGAAIYANLVIDPGMPSLADVKAPPRAPDALTDWQAAPPVSWPTEDPLPASDIPATNTWRAIGTTSWGLVDLSRAFRETDGSTPEVAWLRTTIDTTAPERRTLSLGWVNQVSAFLNGKRVFAGENLYHPVSRRISPDGRLEPDNASIPLDLVAGHNELVLAVGNAAVGDDGVLAATHDGWGAEAHLDAEKR